MPESTIDPPVKEPPVPQTPTRPNTPQPTEPDPPEPETDDAQASSLTFGQRLNAVAQSLRGRGTYAEIEQLRAELSALTTERNKTQADLQVAQASLGVAQAERDRAMGLAEAAAARLTRFDQEVINASVEMVAQAHVPVSELPIANAAGSEPRPQTREQVEKALEGKSFQEKHEILRQWRNRNRK